MSLPGRPFTSVVLAGALLVLAAIVTWAFLAHEKPHPDRLAAAQFQAEADYREAVRFAEHERERCDRAPEAAGCDRIPSRGAASTTGSCREASTCTTSSRT
jgi:hypothetical protein